ncbi:MAG: hypothetical protein ACUVSY_11390 [Roseiflexus sp.]
MNRISVVCVGLLLTLCLLFSSAVAKERSTTMLPSTEPLTVLADIEGPGHRMTGVYVIRRTTDGSGRVSWRFRGMLGGEFEEVDGEAFERWSIDGSVTVELTQFNHPGFTLDQLPARRVTLMPGWDGLIVIAGVPLAVKGEFKAPTAGSSPLLVITNAGRGARVITGLPNTAGSPDPEGVQQP